MIQDYLPPRPELFCDSISVCLYSCCGIHCMVFV